MGHARIRGSRGWVTARGHPFNVFIKWRPASEVIVELKKLFRQILR